MSDEDRLIQDGDLIWYDRVTVLKNKRKYNFYITTDFATSEKSSSDYSVISVWAYNNNGDWLWVDGICRRQLMDKNVDDLFKFCQMYKPQGVGVEVTGQQGGFIQWIQNEMISRNIFFNLLSDGNKGSPGMRPNTNKMQRFNVVVPLFKLKKIWFPKNMEKDECIAEAMDEIKNASASGFKSKHDDFIDTISMLGSIEAWKPSEETEYKRKNGIWEEIEYEEESKNSLIF
jgi:phage terminase large subunit-like protein